MNQTAGNERKVNHICVIRMTEIDVQELKKQTFRGANWGGWRS